jgi:hypothetical protein
MAGSSQCAAGERGVNLLHADPAQLVEAEFPQVPEDRVGGLVVHVELNRVAVGPGSRPGLHHEVLDAGGGRQPVGQLPGDGRRAHHPDVQHPSPSASVSQPGVG